MRRSTGWAPPDGISALMRRDGGRGEREQEPAGNKQRRLFLFKLRTTGRGELSRVQRAGARDRHGVQEHREE